MVLPLWKQFAVSCKTKYTLTIQPIKYTLGHLFQRNGKQDILIKTYLQMFIVALIAITGSNADVLQWVE